VNPIGSVPTQGKDLE